MSKSNKKVAIIKAELDKIIVKDDSDIDISSNESESDTSNVIEQEIIEVKNKVKAKKESKKYNLFSDELDKRCNLLIDKIKILIEKDYAELKKAYNKKNKSEVDPSKVKRTPTGAAAIEYFPPKFKDFIKNNLIENEKFVIKYNNFDIDKKHGKAKSYSIFDMYIEINNLYKEGNKKIYIVNNTIKKLFNIKNDDELTSDLSKKYLCDMYNNNKSVESSSST